MRVIMQFLLGNPNIWTPLLVLVIGVLSRKTWQQGGRIAICEKMLSWFCFLCLGLFSFYNTILHIFFGTFTAHQIGWQPSPFQYEVGVANAIFAVLGFMAFKIKNYHFRYATLIGFAVWFWGDAIGHIYQLSVLHDTAAYNAGSTLYTDILTPVLGLILLRLSKQQS